MTNNAAVLDLTNSDEEAMVETQPVDMSEQVLNMWIPMPAHGKDSVRMGPGRGHGKGSKRGRGGGPGRGSGSKQGSPKGGQMRFYVDADCQRKMNQFGSAVGAAANEAGFVKFSRERPLAVECWCFLERPKDHFTSKVVGAGRLKQESAQFEGTVQAVKPDADNLAKFVLDALTGVLFEDDAQVVDLRFFKCRDSAGICSGRVALHIRQFKQEDFHKMIPKF